MCSLSLLWFVVFFGNANGQSLSKNNLLLKVTDYVLFLLVLRSQRGAQSQSGKSQLLGHSHWILSAISRTAGHIHPLSLEHLFLELLPRVSPRKCCPQSKSKCFPQSRCLRPVCRSNSSPSEKLLAFPKAHCIPPIVVLHYYTKTYTAYQIEVVSYLY